MTQIHSLDDELDIFKRKILKNCHSTKFTYNKGEDKQVITSREKVRNAFWESIKIWKQIDEAEQKGVYSRAFFFAHLYIRLVLAEKLHRRKEPDLKNVSVKTLERLRLVEQRLEAQINGIKRQLQLKRDMDAENQLKADQKKEIAEREAMRKKEIEANKFPTPTPAPIIPPINPTPGPTVIPAITPSPTPTPAVVVPSPTPGIESLNIKPTPSYPSLDPAEDVATIPKPKILPTPSLPPPASVAVPAAVVVDNKPSPAAVVKDPFEKLTLAAWRKKVVTGDGNCAFRSVAQGMARGGLSQPEETKRAAQLRKDVCKQLWVKRNKDIKGLGLTVEQLVTMDPDGKHDNFRSYLNGMAKSDYAGEVELILMAQNINRPIFVYQPDGTGYKRIATYLDKGNPVCLVWQKGLTEGGNHYNVLLKN